MKIYVESNFVLELALQQEQSDSCMRILQMAQQSLIELCVPAYSLVEPNEKLGRQRNSRQELVGRLLVEQRQLQRNQDYLKRLQSLQDLSILITQSNEDELARFRTYREQILDIATVIPMNSDLLIKATAQERRLDLSPQDAIVYQSVLFQLVADNSNVESCFLNRNAKDFDNPTIVDELAANLCRMIPRFDDGYAFIQSRIRS